MNICHVNLASGFSGGERQTLQLIHQQLRLGYRLVVVANPASPFYREVDKLDCQLVSATHYLKQHSRSITQDCQLIHVHEGRAIYWALIQSVISGLPYLVTRRIDNPLKKKWLSQLAYSKASALIGLSNEIVSQLKKRHPSQAHYLIPSSPVSYPVDQQQVEQIKQRFKGKFLVIQAANLLKHKGHNVSINAAKALAQCCPNVHIALLGDGPEKDTLQQQAQGLNNLSFEGKQSNMGDWFAAADMLIHPSYSEGLGSVILEAIQSGLPVAASKAGGIPDIIDGTSSGLLIEPGHHEQLAQHIVAVQSNPELKQQLIDGGQAKMQYFDIAHTANLYQNVYQQVISDGQH